MILGTKQNLTVLTLLLRSTGYIPKWFGIRGFILSPRFALFIMLEVLTIKDKNLLINEAITHKEVRLIGADGSQMGICSAKEALKIAEEADLDLVEIAPQATPPVCRVMNYGKYCFEQAKKEKEARKNQKVVNVKEIQMLIKIDTNDFNTKANHAIKFLQNGDKVKYCVRFKGREMAHTDLGLALIQRFLEYVAEYGSADKPPKLEGRNYTVMISPKTTK